MKFATKRQYFFNRVYSQTFSGVEWVRGGCSLSATAISERKNILEIDLLSDGKEACNYIMQIMAHLQTLRLWQRDAVLFIIGLPPYSSRQVVFIEIN